MHGWHSARHRVGAQEWQMLSFHCAVGPCSPCEPNTVSGTCRDIFECSLISCLEEFITDALINIENWRKSLHKEDVLNKHFLKEEMK